ncbi:MAG: CpaD family pilus assembly protein [Bradyrhizobiaceae bacterium]|nr:CpaD family pilus assembly protein [Bradyrhizobiaceae bacterium]
MSQLSQSGYRERLLYGGLVLAITVFVAACNTDRTIVTGSVPLDYRERHPIRITEAEHDIQLLVGSGRGDLNAEQRAQVTAMAGNWHREGTGIFRIEVPKGSPNERAAKYAVREVQSLLRASGVAAHAITTKTYSPPPESFGPIRIAYQRIEAQVGPCGLWPEDLGASLTPSLERMPPQYDNRPHYNFGCSTQQNLAASVSNPQDLVQPRAETAAYAPRRQTVIEKYRKGEMTAGQYESSDAKISKVGQ